MAITSQCFNTQTYIFLFYKSLPGSNDTIFYFVFDRVCPETLPFILLGYRPEWILLFIQKINWADEPLLNFA